MQKNEDRKTDTDKKITHREDNVQLFSVDYILYTIHTISTHTHTRHTCILTEWQTNQQLPWLSAPPRLLRMCTWYCRHHQQTQNSCCSHLKPFCPVDRHRHTHKHRHTHTRAHMHTHTHTHNTHCHQHHDDGHPLSSMACLPEWLSREAGSLTKQNRVWAVAGMLGAAAGEWFPLGADWCWWQTAVSLTAHVSVSW